MKSEWIIPHTNQLAIETISRNTGIDKNVISILYNRGVIKEEEIINFIFPELNDLHSPFLLHGVHEAVIRLKAAVAAEEKIAIFGDSDLDGITSLTIIYNILIRYGCSPIIRYPKAKESYGLTCDIIEEFIKEKITLVITVDSGIRDVDEVNYGKKNGIDFIITDHHEPDIVTPEAIIINPKKNGCEYPFKELAGVGVAFKFIQAFLYSYTSGFDINFLLFYKNKNSYTLSEIKNGTVISKFDIAKENIVAHLSTYINRDDYIVLLNKESLTLSSIFKTINPLVIITDIKKIASMLNNIEYENHESLLANLTKDYQINTKYILKEADLYIKLFIELQWRSSKKIMNLLRENVVLLTIGTIADIMPLKGENRQLVKYGLSLINKGEGHTGILSLTGNSKTTAKTISWDIAPLLNAPGRMGATDLTVNFFLEKDILKNTETINSIHQINRNRKKLVLEIIEKIKKNNSDSTVNDNIFFYMHEEIIDGLAGLIANRIADEIKKPVIVATGSDINGLVKGSARSSGNFDFFKHTATVSHLFERVGGHAQAFGFTAKINNIKEIINTINTQVGSNFKPDKSIQIDSIIKIENINSLFIKNLSLLEPFGKCNELPVFAAKNIKIESFDSFGTNGNHGKYTVNRTINAIGWNMFDKMNSYFKTEKCLDLIFTLENNEYRGKISPRVVLLDIDFSG